jgi:hypothetical protein
VGIKKVGVRNVKTTKRKPKKALKKIASPVVENNYSMPNYLKFEQFNNNENKKNLTDGALQRNHLLKLLDEMYKEYQKYGSRRLMSRFQEIKDEFFKYHEYCLDERMRLKIKQQQKQQTKL